MPDTTEANSSTLIRYSEIVRHTALDSLTLEELGRVEALWMYPQVNRVLGLICKPSLFGPTRLVLKLPQIQSVKTHVLVEGTPEETVVQKVEQLESLLGTSVWSDAGEPVGTITDCLFDLRTGVIIRYLMVPDSQVPRVVAQLTEGVYLLSPKQIKSFSRQRVLIADETVSDLRLYSEGLRIKLTQMSSSLTQDYWHGAAEEWESFSAHLQSIAAQAKDTLMTLAEKAKVSAQTLSQTLSQTMTAQMERFSDLSPENTKNHSSRDRNTSGEPVDSSDDSETDASLQDEDWTEVIQPDSTSGDVFDFEDWQYDETDGPEDRPSQQRRSSQEGFSVNLGELGQSLGELGRSPFQRFSLENEAEQDREEWDETAPWDDWDEPEEASPPLSSAEEQPHSDIQSAPSNVNPSPHFSNSDNTLSEQQDGSDRVSDLNPEMDDPWIT